MSKVNKIETPKTDAFLTEIIEVYKRHGMAISHEDDHGNFIVESCSQFLIDWIRDANLGETNPEELGK